MSSFFHPATVVCPWCNASQTFPYAKEPKGLSHPCKKCKRSLRLTKGTVTVDEAQLKEASQEQLLALVEYSNRFKGANSNHSLALQIANTPNASDKVLYKAAHVLRWSSDKSISKKAMTIFYALADKKYHDVLKDICTAHKYSYSYLFPSVEEYGKCDFKKYLTYLAEDYGDKEAAAELKKIEEKEQRTLSFDPLPFQKSTDDKSKVEQRQPIEKTKGVTTATFLTGYEATEVYNGTPVCPWCDQENPLPVAE